MEQEVSKTILQQPETIVIGKETYQVAPPTFATLIMFSGFVAQLPKEELSTETPIASLLAQGENLENICKALSCIIIGAKDFYTEEVEKKNRFFSFFQKKNKTPKTKGEQLYEKLLHTDVGEISKIFYRLLSLMQLKDFFQLTTSLIQMNIIKPTKTEVGN